jgi:hypothetical protein
MMDNIFHIKFTLGGKLYDFQVTSQNWGNGKRYAIRVDYIGYLFEPNDEGQFRFKVVPGQSLPSAPVDTPLLTAIGTELEKLSLAS